MSNNDAKILNDLIATTIDSAEGYREAAEEATSERYAMMFRDRAQERQDAVVQLRSEVRRLGETPEDDGTLLASGHRMFMNLRNMMSSDDDEAIIKEVERGEDHIVSKYEEALGRQQLDPASRQVVQQAWTSVKQGHDQMSALQSRVTG